MELGKSSTSVIEKIILVVVLVIVGSTLFLIIRSQLTAPTEEAPSLTMTVSPTLEQTASPKPSLTASPSINPSLTPLVTPSGTITPTAPVTNKPTPTPTPTPILDKVTEIVVRAYEYTYDPPTIQLKAGSAVRIFFENKGLMAHDFVIDELNVNSGIVPAGETKTIEFDVPVNQASTYEYYCSIDNHRFQGMEGRITVTQ